MHLRLPSLHYLMLACCTVFPENGSMVHVIEYSSCLVNSVMTKVVDANNLAKEQ